MAKLTPLSEQDARDIVFDCHEDYRVVGQIGHENRRWAQQVDTIVRRESDGKLFRVSWDRGLTESQEHDFYGTGLVEVERKTKTVETVHYEEV